MGRVDCRDEGVGVTGPGEGASGVVDGGIEVLQGEDPAVPLTELGEALTGVDGAQPVARAGVGVGDDWNAALTKSGPVEVESRAVDRLRGPEGVLRGGQNPGYPLVSGEVAFDVAGHGDDLDAVATPRRKRLQILGGPVPDLHLETSGGDGVDALEEGLVEVDHLGAGGEREGVVDRNGNGAHRATSSRVTVRDSETEMMAARAISRDLTPSSPVGMAEASAPLLIASTKATNSAT